MPREQTADKQGLIVTVKYDSATKQWTASDGSTVTAKESNAGWSVETSSGFKGYVSYREAIGNDVASIKMINRLLHLQAIQKQKITL